MGTTRSFSQMLNDYLPTSLLKEEVVKRDYFLSKVEKDDGWLGASTTSGEARYIVPFKAAGASSIKSGGLTAANDIAEDKYVRGYINEAKEIWGSLMFYHRDLMEHDKISEKNFLKILPGAVEDFVDYMKAVVSQNLLCGAWFDTLSAATSAADGIVTVYRPDKWVIGQKVKLVDGSSDITGYVKTIDMNTKQVLLVTARGGSTALDFQAGEALDAGTKAYNDGFDSSALLSLRTTLLSYANGGDETLHGQTKASYPFLQAINVNGGASGLAITAANIMEKIFDSLTTVRQFGRGNPTDIVMSYKHFANCLKSIEVSKGAFNVTPGSQKASVYGWTELEVGSVTKGGMKLVAVQEMMDDVIYIIDWRSFKFASNGFIRRRRSPDGNEYFESRDATAGYSYIVDHCLFGELVVERPSYSGVIHSISY